MLLEQLKRVTILLEVARGESLVSTVESGEKLLSLDDFEDLLPLALSGVDSCWVVSADVEHDNRVVLGGVEVSLHALKVQALGL